MLLEMLFFKFEGREGVVVTGTQLFRAHVIAHPLLLQHAPQLQRAPQHPPPPCDSAAHHQLTPFPSPSFQQIPQPPDFIPSFIMASAPNHVPCPALRAPASTFESLPDVLHQEISAWLAVDTLVDCQFRGERKRLSRVSRTLLHLYGGTYDSMIIKAYPNSQPETLAALLQRQPTLRRVTVENGDEPQAPAPPTLPTLPAFVAVLAQGRLSHVKELDFYVNFDDPPSLRTCREPGGRVSSAGGLAGSRGHFLFFSVVPWRLPRACEGIRFWCRPIPPHSSHSYKRTCGTLPE